MIDKDSKLDLDDVAAGHPVAMRELASLRAVAALWADGQERMRLPAPGVAQEPEGATLLAPDGSAPPPVGISFDGNPSSGRYSPRTGVVVTVTDGVAGPEEPQGESFEEWHLRFFRRPASEQCRRDNATPGRVACRAMYESEVAAKSGEGREAR